MADTATVDIIIEANGVNPTDAALKRASLLVEKPLYRVASIIEHDPELDTDGH